MKRRAILKPIVVVLLSIIITISLCSCFLFYPTYKFISDEKDAERIDINGTVYVSQPESEWYLDCPDIPIGFVENYKMMAYKSGLSASDDIIQIRYTMENYEFPRISLREGLELSEPAAKGISFVEIYPSACFFDYPTLTIRINDFKMAEQIFSSIENDRQVDVMEEFDNLGDIICWDSQYPELFYPIQFLRSKSGENFYFCFHSNNLKILVNDEIGNILNDIFVEPYEYAGDGIIIERNEE